MTFIGEDFAFLALPKVGGGSVMAYLDQVGNDLGTPTSTHLFPYRKSRKLSNFFVFVRNPWDYFVSQWEFANQFTTSGYHDVVQDLTFEDFLWKFGRDVPRATPKTGFGMQTNWLLHYGAPRETIRSLSLEYPSVKTLGVIDRSRIQVAKIEDGIDQFSEWLGAITGRKMPKVTSVIEQKVHATKRMHTEHYYSSSSCAYVRFIEGPIIELFNYLDGPKS